MFLVIPGFNSWNISFLKPNTCDFVLLLCIAVLNIATKKSWRAFFTKKIKHKKWLAFFKNALYNNNKQILNKVSFNITINFPRSNEIEFDEIEFDIILTREINSDIK